MSAGGGGSDSSHPTSDIPHPTSDDVLPPIGGHRVRWLTPASAHIHTGSFNTLHVTVKNERIYGGIFAVRCMPVRHPRRYLSLRHIDGEGHEQEVGMIRDLSEWPAEAQRLVEESLRKRYFVHEVRGIEDIRQMGGYLHFKVETDLGPVQFTMRSQSDRAQEFGSGGKMLIDTDENRYLVPDVEALPERDRRVFRRYVYW